MSLVEEKKPKKVKKKKRKCNFVYDFVKVTGVLPTLIWFRPKTVRVNQNVPKRFKKGVLIAPNHGSFLDPVRVHCVFWYRRLHCLATKNLFDTKLKNWFFNQMNCIMIDKDNFHMSSFRVVCERLKEEKAVVVFPEGTVNRDDESLKTYKSGVILMAHISRKPVVPVYFAPVKHWYSRRISIVGEPIDVNALCGAVPTMEEIEKASNYIREKELELMQYYHDRFDKKKKNKES